MEKNITKMKGKKALSMLLSLIMVLSVLTPAFSMLGVTTSAATVNALDAYATIITASDFQAGVSGNPYEEAFSTMIQKAKAAGVNEPDGFILGGDYDGSDAGEHDTPAAYRRVESIITSAYPYLNRKNIVGIQGNHDVNDPSVIDKTGPHEYDDYIVYVINNADYPAGTGGTAAYNTTQNTARNLEAYLNKLKAEGETRPIFIATHIPLHHNSRNPNANNKDANGNVVSTGWNETLYGRVLFDVINKNAEIFDIVFLFGHNHSDAYDDYIGGSVNYLGKGETIHIADYTKTPSETSYTEETLNFTYTNYGYVGYSNNVVDNTLTMNTFEICPDKIVATRYSAAGQYGEAKVIDRNMKTDSPSVYVDGYNTATVGSATGVVAIASGFDDPAYTWTSSNEGIAKVTGSDRVAKIAYNAAGTATIKVKVTERSDSTKTAIYNYDVIVTEDGSVTPGVAIYRGKEQVDNRTLEYYQIALGDTVALSGSYYGLTANTSTSWSSSDTNVAKVNQFGLVTFEGVGTANITYTAIDNGVEYSAQVKLVISTGKKIEYIYQEVANSTFSANKSYVIATTRKNNIYDGAYANHNGQGIALTGTSTSYSGSSPNRTISVEEKYVWNTIATGTDGVYYLQNAVTGLYLAAKEDSSDPNYGAFYTTDVAPSVAEGGWSVTSDGNLTNGSYHWYPRSSNYVTLTKEAQTNYVLLFERKIAPASATIEFAGEVVNGKTKTVYLAVNGRQIDLDGDYVNIQQLGSEAWTSSNTNVATVDSNGVVTFKGVQGNTVIAYTATDAVNGNTVTASFTLDARLTAETTRLFKYTENVVSGKNYIIANKTDAGSFANAISSFEITYTRLLADRVNVTVEDGSSYIEIPQQLSDVVWTTESAGDSAFYLKSEDNGKYLYANTDGTYDGSSLNGNVYTSSSHDTNTEQYKWTYEGNGKLSNQFAYTDAKLGAQTKTYMRIRTSEFPGIATADQSKLYFFEEIASKPKAVITSSYQILEDVVERTEICPLQTEQLLPAAEHFPDNSKVSFAWSSSNNSIATIDQNGKVTYTGKAGKATITLTATSQAQDTTGDYPVATATVTIEVIGGVGYVDPPGTVYKENAFYKTTKFEAGRRYVIHTLDSNYVGMDFAISNVNKNAAHVRLLCETIDAPQYDENVDKDYVLTQSGRFIWECVESGVEGYFYLKNLGDDLDSESDDTYLYMSCSGTGSTDQKAAVVTSFSDHPQASSLTNYEDAFLIKFDSSRNMLVSKQLADNYPQMGLGNVAKASGGYYYTRVRSTESSGDKPDTITLYGEPVAESGAPTLETFELTDKLVDGQKFVFRATKTDESGSAISLALSGEAASRTDEAEERLMGVAVTPIDNIITTDNHNIIWIAEASGENFYLRNYKTGEYLAIFATGNLVKTTSGKTNDNLLRYYEKSSGNMCFSLSTSNNSIRYKDGAFYESSSGASFELYAYTGSAEIEDNTPVITEIRKQDDFGSVDITRVMQYRYGVTAGKTEQILRYIRGLASGYTVTWSVSDTSIATIDQNGLLTYTGKTGYVDVILTVTGEDFVGNPVERTLKTTFNIDAEQSNTRIAIPETVYMAPVDGASTVGQVYVNNVMNADDSYNVKTVAAREDDMYFGLRVVGAESFTVSVSNATDPSNDINLYTSSGSVVSDSTVFSFNDDGVFENDGGYSLRFSGAGLQPGEKATAKWEITVTMNDGTSKQIYTLYTVMYAPQRTVGATSEARQVENSQNEIMSWITGANSVDHSKWSPIGTFHADKSAAGYFKQDPLYNQNPPTNSTGETANDLINVVVEYPAENTRYENAYVVQAATNGNDDSFAKSYLGLLTVDKSRYTNTDQIPNLKIGFDVLRKSGWTKDSIHTYANYYTLGTSTAFTSTDISAVPGSDWVQERYFTNFAESHSLPDRYTLVPSYNVSDIDGKYIHVFNKSQSIQDFVFYIEREYANAATSVLCTVTDKSTLRERVLSGYNITDGSAEFNDALMKAATILGDPAATQTDIDQTSRELYEAMAEKADVYYALKYDNLFSAFEYSQYANSMKVVENRGTASYLNGTITVVNEEIKPQYNESGQLINGEAYTEYSSGAGYYHVELKPNTEYVFEYDVTTSLKAQAFMFFYNSSGGNADVPTNMSYKVNDGNWQAKTERNSWWGNHTDGAGTYHYVIKFTTGPNTVKAGFRFGNTSLNPVESTFSNIKLIDSAHYYEDAVYSKTESIHKEYTKYGSLITPQRPGYNFLGWKDINGSTVTSVNNATEHLTIYSQWEAAQYKINFNGNGGAGSTTSATLGLGGSVTPPSDFTRDNHTLLGWAFDDDAKEAVFKVEEDQMQSITVADTFDYFDSNNELTLYAVWERNYSVYYSSNGGTGEVAHTYNPRSQAHILPDDSTISKHRYVFLGWALEPDATTPDYYPGDQFYVGDIDPQYVNETKQEVILHAVWMLKEYVVEDTIVIDFGLPVKINVLANDPEAAIGTITAVGKGVESDVVTNTDGYTSSKLTGTAAEIKLESGTAKVVDGKIVYTPTSTNFVAEEIFYYEFKANDNKYYYTTVTVIPATSIYFEETMFTFKDTETTDADGITHQYKWENVGTTITGKFQTEDRPGFTMADADADNVYGTDEAYNDIATYSMGGAKYVEVDKHAIGFEPSAEFTFTGTGFDLFSVTDSKSGTLTVTLYDTVTGEKYKGYVVNTYYGYDYDSEAGSYVPTDKGAIFQVPVFRIRDIPYGSYRAEVKPLYSRLFDFKNTGSYGVYVDSVRIFDPMGTDNEVANDAYLADGEYGANYLEIRDTIIKKNAQGEFEGLGIYEGSEDKSLFFDSGAAEFDAVEFVKNGPKHEVYLAKGQAIAFDINATSPLNLASLQVGMRILDDSSYGSVKVFNTNQISNATQITLSSATEQFYKIDSAVEWDESQLANGVYSTAAPIVIMNDSDAIISLTVLKWGFSDGAEAADFTIFGDEQTPVLAEAAIQQMLENPVPDASIAPLAPENIIVEVPDKVYIEEGTGNVTVKTGTKVEYVAVNGVEITDYQIDEEGRKCWIYTFEVVEKGEIDFDVVVGDGEGNETVMMVGKTTVVYEDEAVEPDDTTQDGVQNNIPSVEDPFASNLVSRIFALIEKILKFFGGVFA